MKIGVATVAVAIVACHGIILAVVIGGVIGWFTDEAMEWVAKKWFR